ncbi:hypothetical protein [Alkaliphilus crotonatoxidans]
MTKEERIKNLEKKIAALEGQVQEQLVEVTVDEDDWIKQVIIGINKIQKKAPQKPLNL